MRAWANSSTKFDLLKIHEASVYKSHLIIQNVEQLQMTREGRVVDIKKTVKADRVSGLRIMKKEALVYEGSDSAKCKK